MSKRTNGVSPAGSPPKKTKTDLPSIPSVASSDRPAPAPAFIQKINDLLAHEKNKDFMDAKNIVLATCSDGQPFARYHIHRGFVKDNSGVETELLYTTTDMYMPKVGQIKNSAKEQGGSPCEYLFWTSPTGDHVRFRGLLHLVAAKTPVSPRLAALLPDFDWEQYRISSWKNEMSAHLRATFLNPAPGSDWPEGGEKELHERIEVGDEAEAEASERFALLILEPDIVDWSETNEKPPRRNVHTKHADSGAWGVKKVAP